MLESLIIVLYCRPNPNPKVATSLTNLLKCDYSRDSALTLLNDPFLLGTIQVPQSEEFVHCIIKQKRKLSSRKTGIRNLSKFHSCINGLRKGCRSAKLRVLQLLRTDMDMVRGILAKDEILRVIYLLRNPRALFHNFGSSWNSVLLRNISRTLCDRQENDMTAIKRIRREYPHRILIVSYETLLQFPLETVSNIYRFLGRKVPPDAKQWLNMMLSVKNDSQSLLNVLYGEMDSVLPAETSNAANVKLQHQFTHDSEEILSSVCQRSMEMIDLCEEQFGH